MDRLNKITLADKSLHYYYKGDPNITIGVLGMVDDTLGVSECGISAIRKKFCHKFFYGHTTTETV